MAEQTTTAGAITAPTSKTNLDIINECDNVPHPNPNNPSPYINLLASIYQFHLPTNNMKSDPKSPHGWLLPSVVSEMPWTSDFVINHCCVPRTVTLIPTCDSSQLPTTCKIILNNMLERARHKHLFKNLQEWKSTKSPILTANFPLSIERSTTLLFGVVSFGVHLNIYTSTPSGPKLWIPQRSGNKSYAGKIDTSFETGCCVGESPLESLVKYIAGKNKSLSEKLAREKSHFDGYLSWFHAKDALYGGEPGLLRPCVQYVYDLEIGEESQDLIITSLNDNHNNSPKDEKEAPPTSFHLYTVPEIQAAMAAGASKPSATMVFLDFFIRHGILTTENEKDLEEIRKRLTRKLPFL